MIVIINKLISLMKKKHKIIEKIQKININELTPIQALSKLNKIIEDLN